MLASDFGDAPAPYPTTAAENGAAHVVGGPRLGSKVDSEVGGVHSATANADDTTGVADDDGVTFGVMRAGQQNATVTINVQNAPNGAKLDAWLDFNGDGSWGGAGEQIADKFAVSNGNNTLTFDVPIDAASGQTFARFRLSTVGNLATGGTAPDGEVEDYAITIIPPVAVTGGVEGHDILTSSQGAVAVYTADLDSDGDLDIIDHWSPGWWENNGKWTRHDIGTTDSLYTYAADIDGDNDLDILSVQEDSNTIIWYQNVGDPGSNALWPSYTVAKVGARTLAAADMDGDGDLDATLLGLSATGGNNVLWLENDGSPASGFWPIHTISDVPHVLLVGLAVADMDRDGDIDVLANELFDRKVFWYENDGTSGFDQWPVHALASSVRTDVLAAADVDGDGDQDVIPAMPYAQPYSWYENDGNPRSDSWPSHVITADSMEGADRMAIADMDGDGDPDIVTSRSNQFIWFENEGQGYNDTPHVISNRRKRERTLLVADMNADGRPDVVAFSDVDDSFDGITIYEALEDKTRPVAVSFTRHTPSAINTKANALIFRVTFSEEVSGVDLADFTVAGPTTAKVDNVAAINRSTYDITVNGGDLWNANGTIGLNFSATPTITDYAGNPLLDSVPSVYETFVLDNRPPRVDIHVIEPNPRATNAGVVSIAFTEPVTGVDITDFWLTRDGSPISMKRLAVQGSGANYTLDLSAVTGKIGLYTLELRHAQSGIQDAVGYVLSSSVEESWRRIPPAASLSTDRNSIAETGSAVVTAKLSQITDVDVTISLSFQGTAHSSDYTRSKSSVVIPAGSQSGSITLAGVQDSRDEPSETLVVGIESIINGEQQGVQQVTVKIEDDDPSPISVTRGNGILTVADTLGIATDIRVSFDPVNSRIVVESKTDGAVASVFRSSIEGLRGITVNLGPAADRFDASGIAVPLTIHGGAGDDTIIGGAWTDSLTGDAGDDSIGGGGGRDTISGGLGDDKLDGGNSVDTLMEVGDDSFLLTSASLTGLGIDELTGFEIAYLTGGNSNNLIDASGAGIPVGINGGMGADTLLGSNFADTLNAGTGDDVLSGFGGRDLMMGGAGNDRLDGGGSNDTLDGGAGVDTVRRRNDLNFVVTNSALIERMGSAVVTTDHLVGVEAMAITGGLSANHIDLSGFSGAVTSTIQGNGGNDTIFGSDGADVITTTSGADVIDGRGGNDVVRSGTGADSLSGGAGNDLLEGEDGNDTIQGGDGNDVVVGGGGNDSLSGGAGVDVLTAVSGSDSMSGGDGNDQLLGGDDSETMQGDGGDDRLFGMSGDDSLDGGAGADSLQGGAGADTVLGNAGDDQVSGGAGTDSIDGGAGSNRLTDAADGNVVIVGTAITSEAIGNEAPLSINRIMLSGGSGKDFFDARQATVPVLLQGGAGNDTLLGGLRVDSIAGGDGDDVISGGAGIDQLSGGAGFDDWLEQADSNFTVNGITVTSEATERERVTDIERIVLIGGNRANTFNAATAGVPVVLIGGRGNDTLIGGSFADTLSGGNRNDSTVSGGDGIDSLNGGAGADVLENDPLDKDVMDTGDSSTSDVFTLLPAWIDAM